MKRRLTQFPFVLALALASSGQTSTDNSWTSGFTGWIFRGMKRFFCWLVNWFMDVGNDVIADVISWLPAFPPGWWGSLVEWFGLINAWVPVDTFLFCAWSYCTCAASIAAFKLRRRFLPF